jgi:two-component system, OmpR family, phosphate regulon sensor histidine kinase PhoR
LGSSPKLRIAAAAVVAMLPAAITLVVLAAAGTLSAWLVAPVIAAGLIAAAAFGAVIGGGWNASTERLDAIGEALEARRAPPHLLRAGADPLGRAVQRLLTASDSVVSEIDLLEEQRDEFEAILRSMTEAVVVTGPRGEIVLLNGAARRLFALDAEAPYRGRDFVELCRDPRLQEFVTRLMRSPEMPAPSAEVMIQVPAQRYLAVNAAPVRTSTNPEWVMVFHDITQLKAYETARTDFIANLTHELRTPLSALYGYAETLMQGVDDAATRRRFLGIIDRQARRLARLIDDLISLSDLERGVAPLKFEPLECPLVVEEAADLMREPAARHGVTLEVQAGADLPRLLGDRDRIHQVLLNLLDNAIKYTPRGGHVTVKAALMPAQPGGDGGGASVALAVSDTGEGIPASDIARLTERFYRVDRARSRELGGTGLGLAIVKHIVQLHRGTLRIESKLREGTTVTVTIPAASPSEAGSAPSA